MFDEVLSKLRDLRRRAEELHGEHSVSFGELFHDEFMLRNTEFSSIDSMLKASGFKADSSADIAAIPDKDWDAFVRARTRFTSWDEMKGAATTEWATRRLGLN